MVAPLRLDSSVATLANQGAQRTVPDETVANAGTAAAPTVPATQRRNAVRQGLLVAGATTVANVLSYCVSVIASRRLGPAEFSVFAAMLSLVIVGVVVSLGLQTVVTRALASQDHPDVGALAGTALGASLAAGTVVAVLAWPLAAFLHLSTPAPVLWTAATLVPLTWAGFVQGAAQGSERFGVLGVVVLAVSAGKVLGGLAGVAVSRSATVTMALTAVGTLIGTAVATVAARALLARPRRRHWAVPEVAKATHALFALFVLLNTDLLLARHYLPAVSAGLYGAGTLVAKVAFWLPQFVSVVALPRLADPRRHASALRTSVLVLVAIGAPITAGSAALGGVAVKSVGGAAYGDAAPYAWRFAAVGSCMALAQLLLYARLLRHDHRAPVAVWSAVVVQVTVVAALAHGSVGAIVNTTLAVVLTLVAVGLVAEQSRSRHSQVGSLHT